MPDPQQTVRDVLETARGLIDAPEKFTTGGYARTAEGDLLVDPRSIDAHCRCALGALITATGHHPDLEDEEGPSAWLYEQAVTELACAAGVKRDELPAWNDASSSQTVFDAYSVAIHNLS